MKWKERYLSGIKRKRRTATTKCKHGNYEVVLWTEKLLLFSCCFEFLLLLFWYMLRAYILFKSAWSECAMCDVRVCVHAFVQTASVSKCVFKSVTTKKSRFSFKFNDRQIETVVYLNWNAMALVLLPLMLFVFLLPLPRFCFCLWNDSFNMQYLVYMCM